MRGKGKIYIWPAYFDDRKSWKEGRRVPKNLAIRSPEISNINKAAENLNLNPVIKQATYPKMPWHQSGVVLVDKKGSKSKIIREIANALIEKR